MAYLFSLFDKRRRKKTFLALILKETRTYITFFIKGNFA